MKILLSLVVGMFIGWVLCIRHINNLDHYRWLDEWQKVAVPEYYRHIVGYDSLQISMFMDEWEVNFCYPNKWEFNKYKLDSLRENLQK